ncbi:TolB family protein [Neobacillus sp. SCS-31]|uniref:TolB family protein n=1 Tax=Neobacillus oceani TaxID=3115292 RepID=UPI00390621F9
MDEEKIERSLYALRNQIHVDHMLKEKLRKKYARKQKIRRWNNPWIYGLFVASVLIALFFGNFRGEEVKVVKADSLNISNAISFLDIGSGEIEAYAIHNGHLFVSIKQKGVFEITEDGFQLAADVTAESLRLSDNGEKLLFSNGGSIFILDLKTKKKVTVAPMASNTTYSHPEWKNGDEIFAAKQTGSKNQIVKIDMQTNKESSITDGSAPVYSKEENTLVFSRGGNILVKDLKNGNESIVDQGKDPAVSMDGLYITYIKETSRFDDVWIADLNLDTKKKITANPARMDDPTKGMYSYHLPQWDSGRHTLFVLKQQEGFPVKVMKISLSEKEMGPEETVERYLQALINRDDDYAKTLLESPPEFLTISNPHQIGYRIINSEVSNNMATIQAEVQWTYTADAYYQISNYEFSLVKKDGHYRINQVNEISNKQITGAGNEVKSIEGEQSETLFSVGDIPKEYIPAENIRISSLAEIPGTGNIVFSLQEYELEDRNSTVQLLVFDRKTKSFNPLARLSSPGKDMTIKQLSIDSSGRYVAADTFPGLERPRVFIYDLQEKNQLAEFDHAYSKFWQGEKLVLSKIQDNGEVLYEYTPKTGQISGY